MSDDRHNPDLPMAERATFDGVSITNQLILAKLTTIEAKLDLFLARDHVSTPSAPAPVEGMPSPRVLAAFNRIMRTQKVPRDFQQIARARMFEMVANAVPDDQVIQRLEGGELADVVASRLVDLG